ncbi:hypothetical protein HY988_05390 [Candidatus Micrarchaeota archaeon]|nr:hypothetical protein [Candidatus Micrarchaeota archaeon]
MQTIEAIISLFFVIVIASVITAPTVSPHLDDSLYRLQIVQDSWRVLYLKGDFVGITHDNAVFKRTTIEDDMDTIKTETGLCTFMDGTRFATSCRGGQVSHQLTAVIYPTFVYDQEPERIKFSIAK